MLNPDSEPLFHFDEPDYFVPGAIGEPGQRTFHLQAKQNDALVTIKCEKQHVMALAEHIERILADLPPDDATAAAGIESGLRQPIVPRWIAGGLSIGYDEHLDRIIVIIELLDPEAQVGRDDINAIGTLSITRLQGTAFVSQSADLVSGSRPLCRLCGGPIDPSGHVCPRNNGHKPPR